MPTPALVPDLTGEVVLSVEVDGSRQVSLAVGGERAAVDEPDGHSAPRSGTESGSTRWSV